MTEEQAKGRNIVIGIALFSAFGTLSGLLVHVGLGGAAGTDWVWAAIHFLLLCLLIKGVAWVRLATMISYILSGGLGLLTGILVLFARAPLTNDGGFSLGIARLVMSGLLFTAGLTLWRSAAVREYFLAETAASALNLNK